LNALQLNVLGSVLCTTSARRSNPPVGTVQSNHALSGMPAPEISASGVSPGSTPSAGTTSLSPGTSAAAGQQTIAIQAFKFSPTPLPTEQGKVTIVNHFLAANQVENVADAQGNVVVLAAGTIGGDSSGIISGTGGADSLDGRGGDDLLFGNGGDDLLLGGLGHDDLSGGSGADSLSGGTGNDTLGGGAGADVLAGKGGDDKLFGGRDDDRLSGGAGSDTLSGGRGADTMNGGADGQTDVHRFTDLAQLGLGSTRDSLINFVPETDKIDVTAVDAKAGAAGDQSFIFIGTGPFTGEGQIRAVQLGFDVVLEFNTAGPDGAEGELLLDDAIAVHLGAGDFLL
jgi:Ca2+-binding RTX toxin-like protein